MNRPYRLSAGLRIGLLLTLLPLAESRAAAGSWVVHAPAIRVAVPGREYESAPLTAPGRAEMAGRQLVSLSWRYQLPAGRWLQAWLCQGTYCMELPDERGSRKTDLPVASSLPWHFRFALPPGERQAVTVQALQLIVNYR